jgi:predicted permease
VTWLRILQSRLRGLFGGQRPDADLTEEIQGHLDRLAEEYERRGVSRDEARAAARREFGGVEQVKEDYRDQRGLPVFDTLARDVRFAARTMRHNPGVAVAVVLSLALGIGANTAIFSVLNAALLRALPVANPEELFTITEQAPGPAARRFSYPTFELFRDATPGPAQLAGMSTVARMQGLLAGHHDTEPLNVQLVSGEYFSVLGLPASHGRLLGLDDNRIVGGHPVAVISESLWRDRFQGALDVIGRDVSLNDAHFTIVGVGPVGFSGVWIELPTDVWIPLVMQHDVYYSQNFSADHADLAKPWPPQDHIWWVQLISRTSQMSRLAAALNVVFQRELAHRTEGVRDPEKRRLLLQRRLVLNPLERGLSNVRQGLTTPLFVLMAMVAVILLLACANGANLLMARASARRREIAIRLSIGASRGRLIQQLLTESSILVGTATLVGVLFARWASVVLARQLMATGYEARSLAVPLDSRVLAFTVLVSIAAGLLFGLAPALRATEVDLGTAMRPERKALGMGARFNTPKLLVVLQVALSLWLVVAAALFVHSFRNLTHVTLGFEPDHVTSVWINPRIGRYLESAVPELNRRLVSSAESLPGVRSAALSVCGLANYCRSTSDVQIAGYQPRVGEAVRVLENSVGLQYFATVGMPVVAGRDFDEHDTEQAPHVAIVNQSMARRYFPAGKAIGQRFGYERPDVEIVGIVADARVLSVQEAPVPMAFYPLAQRGHFAFSLDIRSTGDPAGIVAQARKAVTFVDPNLPVDRILTLSEQVGHTVDQERFIAGLTALFGSLALGLACLGLFGVMSYTVSRRTTEFGVRMALGARPFTLLWSVLRESLTLVAVGLAVGLPTVLMASQALTRVLVGIRGSDPMTLAGATLLLAVVAGLAGIIPAWRASRVDPMVALRCE